MNSVNFRHVSLNELAKEYNLSLDTLISFQNMGLIRPVKLANQKALFGPFSHLRIRFILNATSQGLSFADVLTLIGKVPPFGDEAVQLLKSLEMGEKYAAQLRRQIEISEPLEEAPISEMEELPEDENQAQQDDTHPLEVEDAAADEDGDEDRESA